MHANVPMMTNAEKQHLAILLRGSDQQLHHLSIVSNQGRAVAAGACLVCLADAVCPA